MIFRIDGGNTVELFVDNFAGGGGASTGIEIAIGRSVDIAINHDPDAIAMHKANHPSTKHYCENVWEVDPIEACAGNQVALAWFSPDCKHFSRAKGGKPVDKNIRGLAWVEVKWALLVRPRVMMTENVPEIQTWGPLDDSGKPIKECAGETFNGFLSILTTGLPKEHPAFAECISALGIDMDSSEADKLSAGLGYHVEYRELTSCDYGAPTSRRRFYMIARSDREPIVWPEATHAEKNTPEPYRTIAECIDWTNPGVSIFHRNKPLCEKTMARIARGFKKFILDEPHPFIVDNRYLPYLIQYHSETTGDEVRGQRVADPIMTLDTSNRYALIMPYITTLRNNMIGQEMDSPLSTITAGGKHHMAVYAYLIKYYGQVQACSMDEPLDTLTTKDRFAIVTVGEDNYVIKDIFMRMLTPREMFRASGFPDDYVIDHDYMGREYSRSKQVARCGNAVTPPVATALVRANLSEYCVKETKAA